MKIQKSRLNYFLKHCTVAIYEQYSSSFPMYFFEDAIFCFCWRRFHLMICLYYAIFRFENILDHFITGFLVIIVANVPQGLPAMVMSQLAIIARRMANKNVFIKKLDIIDELGAATVVATDKTGTITQNLMVLTDIWYNRRHYTGEFHETKRELLAMRKPPY